jgi:hypothetical protein
MNANEIGLPTFEAGVSCGTWCQGGSVAMTPTTQPEYTDAEDVWVKGDAVAALAARLAEAERLLRSIADNSCCGPCQEAKLVAASYFSIADRGSDAL